MQRILKNILIYLILLFVTTVLYSCYEKSDANLDELSILIYERSYDDTVFKIDDKFQFLNYDTIDYYFSEIDRQGNFRDILRLSDFLPDSVNIDSIQKNANMRYLSDGTKYILFFNNSGNTFYIMRLTSQNTLSWTVSDTIADVNAFNFKTFATDKNGNLNVVLTRRDEFSNPGSITNVIKEKKFDMETGEKRAPVFYNFEATRIESIYNCENEGYYFFRTSPPNQPFSDSLTMYLINGELTTIKTNLKFFDIIGTFNYSNNFYFSFFDENNTEKIAKISIEKNLEWAKQFQVGQDTTFSLYFVEEIDNNLVLTGNYFESSSFEFNYCTLIIDNNLEVINKYLYDFSYVNLISAYHFDSNYANFLCKSYSYTENDGSIILLKTLNSGFLE